MPKLVDHNQRKEQIADAAIRAIKDAGIEKTTVRKIANEAGVSMGTIQYYFPAQHDLYIYVMELISQRIEERIESSFRTGATVEEEVVTALKQLIPYRNEHQMMESEVWISFSLTALRDPALEALSHHIYRTIRELMKVLLRYFSEKLCLGTELDIENEALQLHAFIDGLTLQAVLYPKDFDEAKIEKLIMNYLRNIKRRSTN